MLSFALAEVGRVTFLTDLAQHLIRGRSAHGLPGTKYPDAVLFGERSRAPDRTQRDFLSGAFHFQVIARLQAEFFPQWLRNHDATSLVQSKADVQMA